MPNDKETRDVICAIASILKEGEMPSPVPPKYRQALQDLSDAREDRTAERKSRFERALKELQPVLRAADASSTVSMTKHVLKIDGLLTTWRRVCSDGPAYLPNPQLREKFEHKYFAFGGETVSEVARKFRFESPNPLNHPEYGYPLNMRLRHGDVIYVPYTPSHLRQLIGLSERMIRGTKEEAEKLLEQQHLNQEEFEGFLLKIEAISILANVGVGLVEGAKITSAALNATSRAAEHEAAEEALHWIIKEGAHTNAEILGAAIEASKAPKKGFFFYLRHSPIGWLSPAYWASMIASLKSGEPELFLYGPEGLAHKRAEEIVSHARRYVEDLGNQMDFMRAQLQSRIYYWKP